MKFQWRPFLAGALAPAGLWLGLLLVCVAISGIGTWMTRDSHPNCSEAPLNATSAACTPVVATAKAVGAALFMVVGPGGPHRMDGVAVPRGEAMSIDTWPEFLVAYGFWAAFCGLVFWALFASRPEASAKEETR